MSRLPACLRLLVLAIAAFAVWPLQARAAPPPRYNIVFVLVDDLRYDAMGFLMPGLRTPNIDFLARHGTHFPNAVVTSALCSPSRATILTGLSTRNHGIVDNNNASEAGLVFFPSYLRQAGYQTAFVGKWHMGADNDAPRPGFDKWVSFKGQGSYLPTEGLTEAEVAAGKRRMLNVDGRATPQTGYITDELTDYAVRWLGAERDRSKPFFLYLSHKAVHSEATPAARHASQYADLHIPMPESMANTPANNRGKPLWVLNQRNSWHGVDFFYHTDRDIQAYYREYLRTLSAVDDSLGRILAELRRQKLDRNTMVVFYSDNGFLMGEHGLIDKRNAYEPSVRVPMVAYAPGLIPAGVTNPVRVRNLDLAPTFLEVAGASPPPHLEGQSLLPVMSGRVAPSQWPEPDFVYEYYWEWSFPHTPTTFAIRRGPLKYIQYHGVWDLEELYDLSKDPHELRNLVDDPAHLQDKIDLRRALFEALANRAGEHKVPYTARLGEGIVWRNADGPGAADFPARWLKAPNLPTRGNGLYPDSPDKAVADRAGEAFRPPPREGTR